MGGLGACVAGLFFDFWGALYALSEVQGAHVRLDWEPGGDSRALAPAALADHRGVWWCRRCG